MKRVLFIAVIFYLFLAANVKGQNNAIIDSLKSKLETEDPLQRLDVFKSLAWEYRKSYPDSTLFYSQKAIAIASQPEFQNFMAQPLNYLGLGYFYLGNNLKAFESYQSAKDFALDYNDSLQYGHALNNIGRIYFNQGNYISAYNYFLQSTEVYEATGNKNAMSYGYKSLAELYQTQDNLPKALEMSLKTAELRETFSDPSGTISIYLEIASIYSQMEEFDSALSYFDKAFNLATDINDEANLAIIKLSVADMFTTRALLEPARSNAAEALNFAAKSNNINLLIKVNYQLGLIYFLMGDYNNSENYFLQVKQRASEFNNITHERDAHLYLSKIYENKGRNNDAFENYKLYTTLKEKTDNIEDARNIQRLESRLVLEVKEKENQILKLNEEAYKTVISKQKSLNIALALIAILIFILLIILWNIAQKRKKYNKTLLVKNNQIEEHQSQITAQNLEINAQNKALISRNSELDELNNEKDSLLNIVAHDMKAPFQRIKGLTELLRLSGLSVEQEQYVQMINLNSKHGTSLIHDLLDVNAIEIYKEDPMPSKINLKSFLENKAANFVVELTNKEIECIIECEPDQNVYSDESYLNRILDNLISNAIKFSQLGAEVILRAGTNQNGFWISVKDFGLGFTEEDRKDLFGKFKKLSSKPTGGESSNGLGLAIVKTLTERLKGKIILNSEKGEFSEFTIFFPPLNAD